MMLKTRAPARLAAVLTTAVLALSANAVPPPFSMAAPPSSAASPGPAVGATGIGDPLFPALGNGGYDARHYDLRLRYATADPTQGIDGTLIMRARAAQSLRTFNLDFGGDTVAGVRVNGEAATFSRHGEELVITPAKQIRKGRSFHVRVSHFTSHPQAVRPQTFGAVAFVVTPDGSVTAGQPAIMHDVFPSNDHPRDKASFTFRFNVPRGQTAVANGVLTHRRDTGRRSIWTYEQRQPMATELTQLAVGRYTVIERAAVRGVEVRDVVPTRLLAQYRNRLAVVREQLPWMQARVGRYPFDTYGSLVADVDLGFALETQTLSLYDGSLFDRPPAGWEPVTLHELAHQWFGDSVAPYEWGDVWQDEGHATWYELGYAADKGYLEEYTGVADFTELMKLLYADGDQFRAQFGPVARPRSGDPRDVFNPNAYAGGALTLYALRQKIGAAAFDRVERTWVRRYRGRSASTTDFIRLAARVSGQASVEPFLREWLYGTTTPPMPGHPDWTVAAARSASPEPARRAAADGWLHALAHR